MNPLVAQPGRLCGKNIFPSKLKENFLLLSCCFAFSISLLADTPAPPVITNISSTGTQRIITWTPYLAAKSYTILSSTNVGATFITNTGAFNGFQWTGTSSVPANFFKLAVTPLSSNELLTANILNRIAYGPTPDDLDRILNPTNGIGPDAYIAEQLAPETITETVNNSHTNIGFIEAKFADATDIIPANPNSFATIDDFRAWHVLRAVGAKRQLLEVLLQFFENHFVTQFSKSDDYFDQFYDGEVNEPHIAAQFEYLENQKWRAALLNPTCTFYDMLKISAESPAMIIFLDTVTSKGNGSNIANENYARELMELFTMGVDNGYTQNDITAMSRSWTGWTLQIVDPTNAFNPFAARTTNNLAGVTNNFTTVSNLAGVWAFNFASGSHDTNRSKVLFTNAFVPTRFGAPYTTKLYPPNTTPGKYQLTIPTTRTGTNGIQDGYDVINFLPTLPFTEEFISIKLCRLFVHDDFPNPSNDTNNPAYDFYNYAAGNLSPEAQLVRDCMTAWENSSPKGQLRPVLQTIFNSDLFRSHGGSMQKVKTPLEYAVSAVRALRSSTNGTFLPNSYSADTDGRNIVNAITSGGNLESPLNRMGGMSLFDRAAPDGYPEDAPFWLSAGSLAERIRFVQSFSTAVGLNGHTGTSATSTNDAGNNTYCSPVSLIVSKLPATSRTNATAVVDYVMGLIYPGEGLGNLNQSRTAAINFLNDGSVDSPVSATPFANLAVSGVSTSAYDIRVRGMIGYLLSLQRFHEQ
jgi:uncharacterized protein (DUF1800 family)